MTSETFLTYIELYGYVIISVLLFFGIVGIPAPEESLLLMIGVLTLHHNLSFELAMLSAVLGAFIGMITAYVCGKYIGYAIINKFGKYVGLTQERLDKVKRKTAGNFKKSIIIGFFIPGLRQIVPYFAGIAHFSFKQFVLYSLLGSILWITPYIVIGYYIGDLLDLDPKVVPYIGILFFALFFIILIVKLLRKKKA